MKAHHIDMSMKGGYHLCCAPVHRATDATTFHKSQDRKLRHTTGQCNIESVTRDLHWKKYLLLQPEHLPWRNAGLQLKLAQLYHRRKTSTEANSGCGRLLPGLRTAIILPPITFICVLFRMKFCFARLVVGSRFTEWCNFVPIQMTS